MQPAIIAPAPWHLTGSAFIMVYHFPRAFLRQYGFLAPYQKPSLKGWVGAVIMADYQNTPVGPYKELLFVPGFFKLHGKLRFSVSKAYVSTYDSVWNGQQNWGVPKEQADFRVQKRADGSHLFDVAMGSNVFFHADLRAGGLGFPLSSRVIPFFRLAQELNDQLFRFRPRIEGKAQLSFVSELDIQDSYFPPVQELAPLAILHMKDFKMRFPAARISELKR